MFEKFVNASNEVTKVADSAFTLSMGTSPFQDGVSFKVTGYGYQQAKEVGKDIAENAYANPVLITDLESGDGSDPNAPKFCSVFISMLIKRKVAKDGTIKSPTGEINKAVIRIITDNPGKPNGTILKAILEEIGNKEVVVSREYFPAVSKDGRDYTASIINLNYKK